MVALSLMNSRLSTTCVQLASFESLTPHCAYGKSAGPNSLEPGLLHDRCAQPVVLLHYKGQLAGLQQLLQLGCAAQAAAVTTRRFGYQGTHLYFG